MINNSDQNLKIAMQYLSNGASIIPLCSPSEPCGRPECEKSGGHGKRPLLPMWKEYQERFPTEDEVRQWWSEWPNANFGGVTGKLSDIFVMDFDGKDGIRLLKVLFQKFPEFHAAAKTTMVSRTGNGYQFYFRYPGKEKITIAARVLPGFDYRGEGGYVVLPGSTHLSGRLYEWKHTASIIELPAVMLDVLTDPSKFEWPTWVQEKLVAKAKLTGNGKKTNGHTWAFHALGGVSEGSRNSDLASFAGHYIAKKLAYDEILQLMLMANEKNVPPLSEKEVKDILDSVWRTDARNHPSSLPKMKPEAFYGLAGDFVHAIEPHSEADPAAMLAQFLAAFGNAIGRSAYSQVEADRHYANLFLVVVGETSKGRKGTAWSQIRKLFKSVEPVWEGERLLSGLSSGEGLIWAVRDQIEKKTPVKKKGHITGYETETLDFGVDDKRLLVLEPEFSSVLRVAGRDGNTLSATVRQAWDLGDLRVMNKNSPAKATDAHISIIGHITKDELRRCLSSTEIGNGFANRFLWIWSQRSKLLPEGGNIAAVDFQDLQARLKTAIDFAKRVGTVNFDDDARKFWHQVYPDLSAGKSGLLGAIISRSEAQVKRLAVIYALLDLSSEIRKEHLEAALAFWDYCDGSCRYIFGKSLGYPLADAILSALTKHPGTGLSRTQIRDLFSRHKQGHEIDQALEFLLKKGRAHPKDGDSQSGRPEERWFLLDDGDQSDKSDEKLNQSNGSVASVAYVAGQSENNQLTPTEPSIDEHSVMSDSLSGSEESEAVEGEI